MSQSGTYKDRHTLDLDVDLSVAGLFLCQSSADADRQYGVRMHVRNRKA